MTTPLDAAHARDKMSDPAKKISALLAALPQPLPPDVVAIIEAMDPQELLKNQTLTEAAKVTTLSPDTIRRRYPNRVRQISPMERNYQLDRPRWAAGAREDARHWACRGAATLGKQEADRDDH